MNVVSRYHLCTALQSNRDCVSCALSLACWPTLPLTACSSADDELQRFIDDTKKEPGGRVEPLPEIKPYETFVYAAADLRSPFVPSSPGSGAGLRRRAARTASATASSSSSTRSTR